jgi:GDP-D-mannose dehydratase
VPYLRGNNIKIREELGWKPSVMWKELMKEMVEYDLMNAEMECKEIEIKKLLHKGKL